MGSSSKATTPLQTGPSPQLVGRALPVLLRHKPHSGDVPGLWDDAGISRRCRSLCPFSHGFETMTVQSEGSEPAEIDAHGNGADGTASSADTRAEHFEAGEGSRRSIGPARIRALPSANLTCTLLSYLVTFPLSIVPVFDNGARKCLVCCQALRLRQSQSKREEAWSSLSGSTPPLSSCG